MILWNVVADALAGNPTVLPGNGEAVTCAAFSPDRKWLATGSKDGKVKLWDLSGTDPVANAVASSSRIV